MSKFGASVFDTVVRWHKSGEVENEYMAYNFSYFAINLPKFIKIGSKFNEVLTETILHIFLRHRVHSL